MVMKETDNVAVCLTERRSGETVEVSIGGVHSGIELIDDIPFAHKFALKDIDVGAGIIKYGEVIGVASMPIRQGQWVHVHNVESVRGRGDKK